MFPLIVVFTEDADRYNLPKNSCCPRAIVPWSPYVASKVWYVIAFYLVALLRSIYESETQCHANSSWENCQNVITKLNYQFMDLTNKGLFLIYIKKSSQIGSALPSIITIKEKRVFDSHENNII